MLRATNVCSVLASTSETISRAFPFTGNDRPLVLSITASDGTLLASSIRNDSKHFEDCMCVSAVAASIGIEYAAMEKLHGGPFRGFTFVSARRMVRCARLCQLLDGGSVFLVIALPESAGIGEEASLGLLRSIEDRIHQDLLPSLLPVLETMISIPPSE
jgi:hypothetical protein